MVRVCVIGAGAAGIAAAMHSVEHGHEVTVYEQCTEIGGTWVYTKETGVHTAMYEVMKTNLPKEVMLYKDICYPDELPSFMDHQDVLKYLKEVAKGLPILLGHTVVAAEPIDEKWEVKVSHNDIVTSSIFDVIFVCNGHYFQPSVPFETKDFKGRFIHSHDYRKASTYSGRKVIVAGAGPSGIDIALQIADHAETVYLLGSKAVYGGLPDNIVQHPVHLEALMENTAELSDGTRLTDINDVIACTGYNMKFPFLSSEIVQIKAEGQMVSPLWEHIVHVKHPKSLFFIGLNLVTVTLTLFEHQVKMALAFVEGTAPVPETKELKEWEENRLRLLAERGLSSRHYHFLGDDQWSYYTHLAELGRFEEWDYHKTMRKIFNVIFEQRKDNIVHYKNINFKMNKDWTDFETIQ